MYLSPLPVYALLPFKCDMMTTTVTRSTSTTARGISISATTHVYMVVLLFSLIIEVEKTILAIFLLPVRAALSRVEHALLPTLPGHVLSVLSSIAWWQW